MGKGLFPYPLTAKTVHLCLDMQRIFAPGGPWATPWMERVLPVVASIASRFPERTVFTRFITPQSPVDMPGMWQRYYSRWRETTRERINPGLVGTPSAALEAFTASDDHRQNEVLGFRGAATPLPSSSTGCGRTGDHRIGNRCLRARNSARCRGRWISRHHCTRRDLQFFRPRPRCTDGGLSFALFGAD